MSVCIYDNPCTMRRECWQDGKLLVSYDFALFYMDPFPIPPERFFFGANIGPWHEGQLIGDAAALEGREKL